MPRQTRRLPDLANLDAAKIQKIRNFQTKSRIFFFFILIFLQKSPAILTDCRVKIQFSKKVIIQ